MATLEDDSTGLGQLLRRARERRGLTLKQISSETKIPQWHLEALEHENLASVPGGFYRRAEIRAYARAVHLDQNLALSRLESALEVIRAGEEAASEARKIQKPLPFRKGVLTIIGVIIAAGVFARAMSRRESALDAGNQVGAATDLPQNRALPVRDPRPSGVTLTSERTQLIRARPSPQSDGLAGSRESTSNRRLAASDNDVTVTTEPAERRVTLDSVTDLVVTTQPAGARVTVDGIGWGNTPVTIRYLSPGSKRIRVSKEGYVSEERVVRVGEGHLNAFDIQLHSVP